MYDARQIANWFVERARSDGRFLSIMSLLKLIYIAHGWHLEMRSAPLIKNKIEAWKYGPVIPDVYNAFRRQGIDITNTVPVPGAPITQYDIHLLDEVYRIYGQMSAAKLSEMTHEIGGPWDQATKRWGWFAPITNDLIRPHFVKKRQAASLQSA